MDINRINKKGKERMGEEKKTEEELEGGDMLQWVIKAKKKDEFEIIVMPMKKKRTKSGEV